MTARPSLLSKNSFPAYQTRGSSSLASPVAAPAVAPRSAAPGELWGAPQRKKGGPSLSLAVGSSSLAANGASDESIHPLKYTWDVWFSQRQAGTKSNKKDEQGKAAALAQKEKESREDWEGGVVKLGGFSSIESLHPFLAHLVPPSALPGSAHSTHTIFSPDSLEPVPAPSNVICDYNVFRSSIAPAWEDTANVGGGRWVVRLRKGVADRVWEEVVYALVSERIGGEDERAGEKVNGVVLSVRKDEDILSLWVAPSSRTERDIIRDALRSALSPLLTATAVAALQLDYKPHPVTAGTTSTPSRLVDLSGTDSPSPRHHLRRGGSERRSHTGALRSTEGRDEHEHLRLGAPGAERRSHGGTPRSPAFAAPRSPAFAAPRSPAFAAPRSPAFAAPRSPGFAAYRRPDGAAESPLARAAAAAGADGTSAFERIERRVRESSPVPAAAAAAAAVGVIGGAPVGAGTFARSAATTARSRESSARFEEDGARWGRL